MQKDPNASDKARRAEQRANEKSGLITIKPLKIEAGAKKGGFKKGGFKSAFAQANNAASVSDDKVESKKSLGVEHSTNAALEAQNASDDDSVGYDYYDPRKPTGCIGGCAFQSS